MKKTTILLFVSLLMISFITKLSAQEDPPKYQAYYIIDDLVKPSKASEYETALKEYIAQFKENNYPYSINVFSTSDFHYYYSTPIDLAYAEIDSLYKYINLVAKANPEKWDVVWKKFDGTYDYNVARVIIYNRELSYIPENPRLKPEDEKFNYWVFTYVKVGKTKEFAEIIKKWKALYQQKNIGDGYSIYYGDIGTEQPLYIWHLTSKDQLDFWTQDNIINEALGDEAKKLWEETRMLLRKIERKNGWYRPELSYIPEKE